VLGYDPPDAAIRVRCTRGTYVRSLCHDVGQMLGCGAALAALRRTFVGSFAVENALPVDAFVRREDVTGRLLSIDTALDLPEVVIGPGKRKIAATGGSFGPGDLISSCKVTDGWVQIKLPSGKLLALGQVQMGPAGPRIHAKRVLSE
jgi:tRNA pseudouridine55 synthase